MVRNEPDGINCGAEHLKLAVWIVTTIIILSGCMIGFVFSLSSATADRVREVEISASADRAQRAAQMEYITLSLKRIEDQQQRVADAAIEASRAATAASKSAEAASKAIEALAVRLKVAETVPENHQ